MTTERRHPQRWIWPFAAAALLFFAFLLSAVSDLPSSTFWRIVAVAAVAFAALGLTLALFLRQLTSRTDTAVDVLNDITTGDLTFRRVDIIRASSSPQMASAIRALVLNLERTISRFSLLASDVNAVSDQIGSRSRALSLTAQQQLTSTQSTSNSVTSIDRSINSVQRSLEGLSLNAEETSTSILEMAASIEEVGRISDTLAEFVEETSGAIQEMIASINEVAKNTESFSSFSIQTASSMVEMNATTVEIGRSAKNSSDLARSVTEAANEGREAARSSVEGMRKIQESVEQAKLGLSLLGERSQEIGEIVRVIDEITGQTNLLALNAAIIAAQAGDRGKGFAVVADEIRDLSERTSVSTEEIRTLIQNVQNDVERVVEQMNASSDRVNEGVGVTARGEKVLEKILDLTERSMQSISQIAKATEEQIRGSQAATHAIEEVTKMVQQTASATQQQSLTSRNIGEQAVAVRDYTKHLKRALEEQEGGSRAIGNAMENIMSAVSAVFELTKVLATESASIVESMGVIGRATRESTFTVSDLNQMSNVLRHESSLLAQETRRFKLPEPTLGGIIRTATVLPHRLTLDPVFCQFMALGVIHKAVHETLVQFGEGAELVPGLAERWEVLEQGHLYRFHLRQGLRFHNGRSFTAQDVSASFHRLMSPTLNSPGKWIMRAIRSSSDVMTGKATECDGIRIIDDFTIEISLEKPLAFFTLLLSMPETGIVPVEEARDEERFRTAASGLGPFIVKEAIDGEYVSLTRNENYYIPGIPHADELHFRLDLKSAKEVADAYLKGELEIAHGVPLGVVEELKKNPELAPYLLDTVQLHTSYLTYDCSHPPFDRVEVRQAMSYAINRTRINERIFSGLGVLANSLLPPGLLGYDEKLPRYEFDPDRARMLLRKAGYDKGFSVDYWRWDTDEFYNSGQIPMMIEDLANVGIKVNVSMHTAVEARKLNSTPGHGTILAGNWYADFPDSDNFFFIFFHSESQTINGMQFFSPELDAKIDEARYSSDIERRTEIYRGLNEMALREAPAVFLFHERFFVIYKPELRGLRTYLVPPPVRYHNVWIER